MSFFEDSNIFHKSVGESSINPMIVLIAVFVTLRTRGEAEAAVKDGSHVRVQTPVPILCQFSSDASSYPGGPPYRHQCPTTVCPPRSTESEQQCWFSNSTQRQVTVRIIPGEGRGKNTPQKSIFWRLQTDVIYSQLPQVFAILTALNPPRASCLCRFSPPRVSN